MSKTKRRAIKHDIELKKGASLSQYFKWTESDGTTSKVEVGATARCQLRSGATAADTMLFEMTTVNGLITLDAATGELYLHFRAEDTDAFTFSKATYDIEIVQPASANHPSGFVVDFAYGVCTFLDRGTQ